MTFLQFAYKNVTRNKRAYLAFFLSSAFSVLIFFTFAMFLFHPALKEGYLNNIAKKGLTAAEWMIFVFSFLFVLYSVNAFLKSRNKEFGILLMQGITPVQLRKLITAENMIIGVMSIAAGIIGGFIFSKTFFTVGAYILEMDALPLYMPWKALGITAGGFLLLFFLLSQFTILFVRSNTVIKLIKGTDKIKPEPKPSVLLSLFGIACLCVGYGMVLKGNVHGTQPFIILLLTVIGTYFFFSQSSIWILRALKKWKTFYLRGKNVIWVSDLVYRLKDNARLFFIVSIISAVAFTATGVLAMYKSTVGAEESAYEMEYISFSNNPKEQTHLKDIDHELKTHGFTYKKDKIDVSYVRYQEGETVPPVYMISESDVSKYFHVKLNGLKSDEAVYFPGTYDRNFKNEAPDQLKLLNQKGKPSDQKLSVKEVQKPLISLNAIIAVNDQTFDQLKSLGDKASLYGYSYDHWKDSLGISQSLKNEIYGNYIDVHSDFMAKAGTYYDTVQLPSLSLFIGLFIAIVFFVAAASFLYFRLFTDLDEDRERYRSLAKIGLSEREMSQSVTIQLAILFFFPFVIAVMHTLFALRTLAVEGYSDVAGPLSLTIGGFFIFQLLFFLVVRSNYLKKMNK
ncbi:ABC transporter permease YxdM [Bacillus stercoris]|uniref:ABC transporter permease YxdM n=1 Tax=Bacillus stercoris TaxID=2054641 RepID=UPI0008FB74AE|nr:ABC transporter permease YxdM [Bacillus stercoris]OIS57106.1 peptide ABC transporter permease [Bacillus subtilis]OIS65378.1 peptide ABC transporter permease [Bacillus subtilis]OIS67020.1 peptide ABC transporter permease [Bacillus subtilis]TII17286.1 ABC transporter permease [Bacillus subtilis]WGE39226.1 ABC transporter permease YxdM [Bacillus stercoris]